MKRTPWFDYIDHSPSKNGMFEARCTYNGNNFWKARYSAEHDEFFDYDSALALVHGCRGCQWRGLMTKDGR